MKKCVCSVLTKVGFAALALSLNFFAACEIGLGSSVDVEAPKIDFSENTLESGAVVRDAFAVFGSWTDDGSIGSINATLKNLATGVETKKAGTVGENLWNVTFSPDEDSIADGSYELSVVIKDSADHETKISRSFIIDNTPPLVVLSRPSTKIGAASFDSYGQKFTLEGKAADDNDVSLIEVNVYADSDCSGSPLKTISLPSVPLTIETDVAEYSKTEANDYSVIYGIVDDKGIAKRNGGTVDRFCKLVVYDGAQRYPADGSAQTEADKKGNSVDYYYLNSDLAELFTEGYKITELYHILNGTYSENAARATATDGVISLLNSNTTKITTGQFRLNPENSPHFVVSARSILEAGHTVDESPLTNGNSKLEVEIAPGLDGHLIKEDTIGIYLVRCDNYGNPLKADGSAAASESEAKIVWLVETDKHAQQADITQSGSTYKFKTKTEVGNGSFPDLNIGENYYVAVVGKDMQGNDILCEGIYGFQLITSGLNIDVGLTVTPDWLSTNSLAAASAKNVSVKLTYSAENKPFEIYRGVGSSTLGDTPIAENITTSPYVDSSIDISAEPTIVVYKIKGNNSAESNVKTIELKYDDVIPQKPTITTCPDKIIADPDNLTFQGKAADNTDGSGIEHVYVQLWNGLKTDEATATVKTAELEATYSAAGKDWLFVMQKDSEDNTIKQAFANVFAAEGQKTIKITSVDKVGLKNSEYKEFIYDKAAPVIKITSSKQGEDAAVSTVPDIVGKTLVLSGSITEGFGIESIKIEQTKEGATGSIEKLLTISSSWTTDALPLKSSTGAYSTAEINNHDADGTYTYKITVTDKAGKSSFIEKTIQLNTTAPTITPKSPAFTNGESEWQLSKNVMISGTASSPATITGIYYKVLTASDSVPAVPANPTVETSWTGTGTNGGWKIASGTTNWAFTANAQDSATNKVYIAAVDNVGNVTAVTGLTLKVDASSPEFGALYYNISGTDTYKTVEGQIYVDDTKTLTVYGKYSDEQSGVKALTFNRKKDSTITYSTGTVTGEVTATALKNLSYSQIDFDTADTTKITYWKATFTGFASDKVGEVKTSSGPNKAGGDIGEQKLFNISYDDKIPVVSNVSFKTENAGKNKVYPETADAAKYWVNNNISGAKFVVAGVATDNFGVDDIELKLDGVVQTLKTGSSVSEWEYELDLHSYTETQSAEVKIQATDVAGKKSTLKSFNIYFDQNAPKAQHWYDAKYKDIYFRISNADNDKSGSTWETGDDSTNDARNKGVGKKYSFGSWGNDSTIQIRGSFDEFEKKECVPATGSTPALPATSGLKLIHYAIFEVTASNPNPTTDQIKAFVAGTLSVGDNVKVIGSFAPLDAVETKNVPYNTTSGKAHELIDTHFNTQLAGFNSDKSCLVLVAEDNVGNRAPDSLVVTKKKNDDGTIDIGNAITDGTSKWNSEEHDTETPYYIINKDMDVPEIESDIKQGVFTNGANAVTVKGTAYDAASGLDKVIISIKEQGINYPAEVKADTLSLKDTTKELSSTNPYVWSFTIPADKFSDVASGKSVTAYATAKDNAGVGNEKQISAATITIDKDPPEVGINTPSDADTSTPEVDLNGTISLSGTADDVYGINKVLGLCYTTDTPTKPSQEYSVPAGGWVAPDGWTKVTKASLTDANATTNWTFGNIDTSKLDGTNAITDGSTVWFSVAVQDKAGNVGYSAPLQTKINQNTDRPIVKFNNLTNVGSKESPSYSLKYATNSQLEGNVSDDDATGSQVVSIFVVSNEALTTAPKDGTDGWTKSASGNEITWTHASKGTTKYNKVTGDYTYTPADKDDGLKTVHFYVKDNKDKEFYTTQTDALNKPYQQYKGEADTRDYNTGAISYRSDSKPPVIQYTKIKNGSDWDDVTASTKVGGALKSKAVFKIEAFDQNGIAEIKLTLNYNLKTDAADAEKKQYKITSIATHDGFTKSGTVDSSNNYVWTTGEIDVSGWRTDSISGTVEVKDTSDLLATASPTFFVDNSGPSINITSPSSTEELTGTQKFAGVSTESGNAGLEKTEWLIPTAAQRAMADAALAQETGWDDTLNGTSSYAAWEFELSGETLGNNTSNATTSSEGVYTLPFYVKATDKLGNFTINRSKTIKYNPEGDRPKTKITYPNDSEYKQGEDFLTLGGAIRITGTSEIPSGTTTVKAVYLQVINGSGNSTDLSTYTNNSTYVAGLTYNHVPCYTVHTAAQASTDLGFGLTDQGKTKLNFATGVNSDAWWGIKVNNAASWNITINNNGEMNPTSGTTNYVAIRACAVNEQGKVGTWTDWYYLNIDDTAPSQEAFMYQFTNAPTSGSSAATILANTNIRASNAYTNGMYLKGAWYLTVKLDDETAINSYEVKKGVDTLTAGTDYYASTKVSGSGNNGNEQIQYLFIPVDTSNAAVAYTVTVQDTDHSISKTYSLNIDNEAPVIESVYKGESYNAANVLTSGDKITDSNYIYTLGSKVDETASGFERLVFYYVRANAIDGKTYASEALLDPLITTGTSDSKALLDGLEVRSFTQGSNTYKLYSKAVAGTLGEDGFTFTPETAAEITGNAHIRKGGLIEANGILRKIEAIDPTSGAVTFDTSSGVTGASSATVYFPYAQVVDNTANESTNDNTGTTFVFKGNSDDGDGMPESVEGSKTTGYNLTATIHSKNMPDGPCALVVLAFDKAGNVSGNVYPVKIENSAPRLAKVWLGTDLNSNGTWQNNEFVAYDLYNADAGLGVTAGGVKETQTIHTAATGSAFKIKDKLALIAEIVGGNGNIMMVYGKDAVDTTPVKEADGKKATLDTTTAITNLVTSEKIGTVTYNNQSNVSTSLKAYTLTNTQLVTTVSEANDGINKQASFTFWDSTDELTQGTDSQNCVLHVDDFTIDLVDGVKPNVVIAPFFWNDKDDNSLYGNSLANGHIELEADWTATDDGGAKLTSWDGKAKHQSTYLDADPKVSGKVVLRGTAYDDKLLKTLQFSMTNFDSGETKAFATYAADSDWTVTQVGTTPADPTMAANYYEVSVTEDYLDQRGHKVSWEIAIDTSHLSDVAHIDAAFTVTAIDMATGSSADRTASETAGDPTLHRPTYVMDVVPYITDVKRNSGYNTHRSGMGNYPMMREEEENSVTGFNLGTTAKAGLRISSASNVITGLDVDDLTVNASGNSATFTIPATAVDGYLQYYVQSGTENVPALNNMNKDSAYTKEEGDSRWYDDRFVKIWQSNANDKFAATYPTYPAMAMGSNGDLFMSYTFYSKSVVYYNQLMSNTKTQIFTAGDQPEETDIMINGTNEVNVIYQANHHYGGSQDRWSARVSGAGSINLYNPSAPNIGTYAIGRYWRFEGTWHNQMLQQLKNAKVATNGNNVYHTIWYDKITKAIKYSNVNKSANQNAYIPNDNDASRPGEIGWVVLDGDADLDDIVQTNQRTTNGYNGGEARYPNNTFEHSYLNGVGNASMYSIALSKTPAQRTAIMNLDENSLRKDAAITANGIYNRYDYTGAGTGTTGYNVDCYESVNPTSTCGEYAAICVTSDGYPVVVYFDVDNKMLKVARAISTNPKGMNTENNNDGAAAWRIQQVALTSGHIGNDASYVSAVIDSAGYLHIAFQNSRGELVYTRSTNTTYDISLDDGFEFDDGSVIVDTNGTWASITVDSNKVPQIAYMANTSGYDTLKLAYPVNATWKTAANWETMYAPMNAKSSNVKTCVVARPSNATGGQPTGLTTYWKTGIGFATSEDYRVMKYIGSGTKEY